MSAAIETVEFKGVYTFEAPVRLVVPERGVVLLRGENGAGKSGVVECLGFGLFGKTLRGRKPWASSTDAHMGHVEVRGTLSTGAAFVARREYLRGKARVTCNVWARDAERTPATHESNTKAQEELARALGVPWDGWRTTHVLTTATATAFTRATDSERKVLVEGLLGASAFAAAHADALRAVSAARHEMSAARAKVDGLKFGVTSAALTLARAVESAAVDVAAVQAELSEVRAALARAKAAATAAQDAYAASQASIDPELVARDPAVQAARAAIDSASTRAAVASEALYAARDRLAALRRSPPADTCASCGQRVPDGRAHHFAELDRLGCAEGAAAEAAKQASEAVVAARQAHEALVGPMYEALCARTDAHARVRAVHEDALRKMQELGLREAALAGQVRALERGGARSIEELRAAKENAEAAFETAQCALYAAECEHDARSAVAHVLSPAGVRARLLSSALAAITDGANEWLAQLAPTHAMRLALSLDGGARDALALTIEGAGGAEGYNALSVGEQRRVDLALMLALAECSAHGQRASSLPLVFDEVFDGLDVKGVEALGSLVAGYAAHRPVFVVSHSPLLHEVLRGASLAAAYEVRAGALHTA